MPESRVAATILVLAAFGGLAAVLGWLAGKLAPPKPDDPRLGVVMFWIWACSVAVLVFFLEPAFSRSSRSVEWIIWAVGALGWAGWKLGILEGWEDSARDREEIWATTVGAILGFVAVEVMK